MAKNALFVSIMLLVLLLPLTAMCQDDNDIYDERRAEGMTLKKVGGANILVPEGSRVNRAGDLRIVEGAGEYAARKFVEVDSHFAKIDSDIAALQKELEEIKNSVAEIRQSANFLKSK